MQSVCSKHSQLFDWKTFASLIIYIAASCQSQCHPVWLVFPSSYNRVYQICWSCWKTFKWWWHIELISVYTVSSWWIPVANYSVTKRWRYPILDCRVAELIPVLCSQPAGDVSHKLGGRLPLLFAMPAVTLAMLKKTATSFCWLVKKGTMGVNSLP